MSYVLFDIGGTNTRITTSDDLRTFAEPVKYKTPKKFEEGIEKFVETTKQLTDGKRIRAIAGGIRGLLNDEKTGIIHDVTLTDWIDKPLTTKLKKALGVEVYLENDSAMNGLGEAHYGAGEGADIMVYHTVSTGVGGVKIEDGVIDDFTHGFEPGKQILDIDQTILGDGIEPTLENLVSGTAVEKRMGVKPYEIPQDDEIWDQLAYYLAQGLRNSILYWSPDVIVLGGSMIVGDPRIMLDDIIRHTNEAIGDVVEVPLIVDAKFRDDGGLYGAMALLNQRI